MPESAMISAEEVRAICSSGRAIQIIDVRPQHYLIASQEIIDGAVRRDAARVDEWARELPKDALIVAVCARGLQVAQETAAVLRAAGIDARCMTGGHAAWKAINGPVVSLPEAYR